MASCHCYPPLSSSTPPPPPVSISLSHTHNIFFPLFLLSLLYCSKNSTQLSIFWKSTQRQHQSKWHHSKYPNSPLIFIGDSLEVLGICKWVCWFISLKMGSIFYHSFCDEFACDGGCLMVEVGCVVEAVARLWSRCPSSPNYWNFSMQQAYEVGKIVILCICLPVTNYYS